ncbi:hypothetical protein EYM_05985 [Ignicoccus islandicus DSM 13165]|uniref:Cation/H+ exchanger transmembrane domain-containing protein n=1 Tax=Ignicoccus islandicus DSM 13165 TaxID=940295 RepID=A0A0U3EBD9_9CREN|nr:hypothetical protein EYM_05985 [Ignicoccus islandicus DSM 13165]
MAKLAEELALKIGLPHLLGPLVLGILMSFFPAFREEYKFAPLLFTVGLNFTAFLMGTEDLGLSLRNVNRGYLLRGLVLFFAPFLASLALLASAIDFKDALLLSVIFAMPSTIRISSLLKHVELEGFEDFLIIDEIAEVIAILSLYLFIVFDVKVLALTVFLAVASVIYGEKFFKRFFEYEEKFLAKEFPLSFMIALILLVGYASESIGLNSAVVSLMMGLVASEYLIERPWLKSKLKAVNHSFFEPLFFVGSSVLVNPFAILSRVAPILIVANFSVVLIKAVIVRLITGWNWRTSLLTTVKGGIDTALLASQFKIGKLSQELYSASIATVLLNTLSIGSLAIKKKRKPQSLPKFCDLELERVAVDLSQTLWEAFEILKDGREAVVVIDASNWPIGYVELKDVIGLSESELKKLRVYEVYHEGVPVFDCNDSIGKVIAVEEEIEEYPLVAVVKGDFGYYGSVSSTKVLKKLAELGAK